MELPISKLLLSLYKGTFIEIFSFQLITALRTLYKTDCPESELQYQHVKFT
jgi:hypothetical protein